MRQYARPLVALAASYAVALQAILLAVGAPLGALGAGFGSLAICSSLGAGHAAPGSTPLGHSGDCPATCLGCCCSPPVSHLPGPAMAYAPTPAQTLTVVLAAPPTVHIGMPAAHRSRAPPLA